MMSTVKKVETDCIRCGLCVKECPFLAEAGSPQEICMDYDVFGETEKVFACSLCRLCEQVCPQKLPITEAFLSIKEAACKQGTRPKATQPYIQLQKVQSSPLLSYFSHSKDTKEKELKGTVFFPGCNLSSTKPALVKRVYQHLQTHIQGIDITLSCCGKPSRDLGERALFESHQQKLLQKFETMGVSTIITACPNCYYTFEKLYRFDADKSSIKVISIYEALLDTGFTMEDCKDQKIAIHDSCTARHNQKLQADIRAVLVQQGAEIVEMTHSGKKALCCGDGAAMGLVRPELASSFLEMRRQEYAESCADTMVSYCGGCHGRLPESDHLLEMMFNQDKDGKTGTPPKREKTRGGIIGKYLNRFLLKHSFAKHSPIKPILFCLFLALLVLTRQQGYVDELSMNALLNSLESLKAIKPWQYILGLAMVPVFFLPTFPAVIIASYLYGPLAGFFYAFIGASLGASISFLFARYLAGSFFIGKIEGMLKKNASFDLQKKVAQSGWKMVLLLRLIPIFPFTPLNYALGFCNLSFAHYFFATALGMLPALAAFIFFSDSLMNLLQNGTIFSMIIASIPLLFLVLAGKYGLKKMHLR